MMKNSVKKGREIERERVKTHFAVIQFDTVILFDLLGRECVGGQCRSFFVCALFCVSNSLYRNRVQSITRLAFMRIAM